MADSQLRHRAVSAPGRWFSITACVGVPFKGFADKRGRKTVSRRGGLLDGRQEMLFERLQRVNPDQLVASPQPEEPVLFGQSEVAEQTQDPRQAFQPLD